MAGDLLEIYYGVVKNIVYKVREIEFRTYYTKYIKRESQKKDIEL